MKRILTTLLLFTSFVSFGQTIDTARLILNSGYGQAYKRWKVDSSFIVPGSISALIPRQIAVNGSSLIYTDATGAVKTLVPVNLAPYLTSATAASTYQPIGSYLTSSALTPYLTSATAASTYQVLGSYATTTQNALKINIADSAAMLANYRTAINSNTSNIAANALGLPYKNVLSYNAVGNNVTSDATAFTNALSGGGAVYVPAGKTYYLTSQVDIPAKTHLIIDGVIRFAQGINGFRVTGDSVLIEGNGTIQGATTASVDPLTAGLFLSSGRKKFLTVKNITFRSWGLCVSLAVIDNPSFDNVKFLDYRTTSIYASPTISTDIKYLAVTNCTMYTSIGNYNSGLAGKGVYLGGYKPTISGCNLDGGAFEQGGVVGGTATGLRDGIWLPGSFFPTVTGNHVRNFGDDGITAYEVTGGIISNNICTASQQTVGIYLLGNDSLTRKVSNLKIENNRCDSNALYGIRLNYAFDVTITNNTTTNNGSSSAYAVNSYAGTGILVESSERVGVNNNFSYDNYLTGITIKSVNNGAGLLTVNKDIAVKGNTCYRNGVAPVVDRSTGINVEGDASLFHPEIVVSDNICYDNGKYGIRYFRSTAINDINNKVYNTDSVNKLPQISGLTFTTVQKARVSGLKAHFNANYGVSAGVETLEQTYYNCDASYNGNGITGGITVGSGYLVLGNNIRFNNCEAHFNYYGGINWNPGTSAQSLYVNGGSYTNNGIRSGSGSGVGIRAVGGGGNLFLNGVRLRDTASTGNARAQLFGVNHSGLTSITNLNSDNTYTYGAGVNGTASSTYNSTFSGGTFVLSPSVAINLGSDATGDMYYRNSSGTLTRLPIGSNTQFLNIASGLPSWTNATPTSPTIGGAVISGTASKLLFVGTNSLLQQTNTASWDSTNNRLLSSSNNVIAAAFGGNSNTAAIGLGTTSAKGYIQGYSSTALGSQVDIQIQGSSTSVGIGGLPDASAKLDIQSTTKGFLPPRMTTVQRDAISGTKPAGLTVYCSDCTATDASTGVMQTYNGSAWKNNW